MEVSWRTTHFGRGGMLPSAGTARGQPTTEPLCLNRLPPTRGYPVPPRKLQQPVYRARHLSELALRRLHYVKRILPQACHLLAGTLWRLLCGLVRRVVKGTEKENEECPWMGQLLKKGMTRKGMIPVRLEIFATEMVMN